MTNTETLNWNIKHVTELKDRMASASVTGGTCPNCGADANPTVVSYFDGKCFACK